MIADEAEDSCLHGVCHWLGCGPAQSLAAAHFLAWDLGHIVTPVPPPTNRDDRSKCIFLRLP